MPRTSSFARPLRHGDCSSKEALGRLLRQRLCHVSLRVRMRCLAGDQSSCGSNRVDHGREAINARTSSTSHLGNSFGRGLGSTQLINPMPERAGVIHLATARFPATTWISPSTFASSNGFDAHNEHCQTLAHHRKAVPLILAILVIDEDYSSFQDTFGI